MIIYTFKMRYQCQQSTVHHINVNPITKYFFACYIIPVDEKLNVRNVTCTTMTSPSFEGSHFCMPSFFHQFCYVPCSMISVDQILDFIFFWISVCDQLMYTIGKNGCYMLEILGCQRNMLIFGCQFYL